MPLTIDFSDPSNYNSVYLPTLNWKERYLHFYGGGGSGKSEWVGQKLIMESFEKRHGFLILRKVAETHRDSTYALLNDWISTWGLQNYFKVNKSPLTIHNLKTDAFFLFRGMDDPEKIKSIKGISRTWFEEASEFTREDINQVDLRMRGSEDLQHHFTYNPIDADHHLKVDWHDQTPPDTRILKTTYLDNRFVGEAYKQVMIRLKDQDPNYYKIYALGEWGGKIEGLIFPNWEMIDQFPEDIEWVYGLDFGYNHPTSLARVGSWDGNPVGDEVIYQSYLSTPNLIQLMNEKGVEKHRLIYCETARPEIIEELINAGYNAVLANKEVLAGINSLKGIETTDNKIVDAKKTTIYLTANSGNGQKEFRKYCWKKHRNGTFLDEPVKFLDDFCDSFRYGWYSHFAKPQAKVDYISEFLSFE